MLVWNGGTEMGSTQRHLRVAALIAWSTVCHIASAAVITPDNPGGGSVQFTANTTQNVKAISPYIYGMNFFNGSTLDNPVTLDRLGGNRWTGYNWETNASNAGTDYNNQSDNYLVGGAANTPPGQAVL